MTDQNVAKIEGPRLPYHPGIKERFDVDIGQWKTLTEAIFPAAKTTDSVILALNYCKARNLDPFKRPVHIVPIWDSKKQGYVETVWPGISELRTTAMRTKVYAGVDEAEFGEEQTQKFEGKIKKKEWTEVTKEVTYPEWCRMTVYKMVEGHRVAFVGPKVFWTESYGTIGASEVPNDMWGKRAYGQLEKCFSPDTEVLTDLGFQRFDSVTGQILQVTDNGLEPTNSKPFRQRWDGPMVSASGDALNFNVTPNHDMIVDSGKLEAIDLYNSSTSEAKHRIPVSVEGTKEEAQISDGALQLTAAFVCDGYKRPYGKFCIAVSREYKINFLEQLRLHTTHYERSCAGDEAVTDSRVITTTKNKKVLTFDEVSLGGLVDLEKAFSVEMLLSLSRRQARLLVDIMLMFDGADNGRGTRRFYSSRQHILAAFELAAVMAGYAVSQRKKRISDIGGANYSITVSEKESLPVLRYSKSQEARGDKGGIVLRNSNPHGAVWCCRVPSEVIVVRLGGMSMLCGNCAEAAALRRAFPEELGNEYAAEEMEGKNYQGPESAQDVTPETERPRRSDYEPKAPSGPETGSQDASEENILYTIIDQFGEMLEEQFTEAEWVKKFAEILGTLEIEPAIQALKEYNEGTYAGFSKENFDSIDGQIRLRKESINDGDDSPADPGPPETQTAPEGMDNGQGQ